jgi:hypothetical protein
VGVGYGQVESSPGVKWIVESGGPRCWWGLRRNLGGFHASCQSWREFWQVVANSFKKESAYNSKQSVIYNQLRRVFEVFARERRRRSMDKSRQQQKEMTKQGDDAHVNKLPDDLLVRILSLLPYTEAVQTASVSRRWEDVVLRQLPTLEFSMPPPRHWLTSRGTPSEQRVQSMERTLHRRCGEGARDVVKHLSLFFCKDVHMECRYVDEFITLVNAHELRLIVLFQQGISSTIDSGAWCLELPPATTVLHLVPNSSPPSGVWH